jgi:hypothetical protein
MEGKKEIVYRQDDLLFKEKYIKEGLETTRKNSSLYSLIMIGVLLLNTCAASSAITSIPNLVYEPSYLCKEENSPSGNFTKTCEKSFVCNENNIEGIDYILNEEKFMRSLITDYGIYCSNAKISSFGVGYFIGGVIGLLILPEILKHYGNIELIIFPSIVCVFCNIGMLLISNYYLGIIVFTISMTARNILQVPSFQYSVEMVRAGERATVIGLTLAMNSFSGLILNLMEITVGDYKGEIISNTFLFLISIILVKLLLIDSASNTFVHGRYKQIIDDLGYVAKVNGSEKEYKKWRDNIYEDSKYVNPNYLIMNENEDEKNKFELVNYYSIWTLKGTAVKLIMFILFFFTSQFNLIFLLYEVKKAPNFFVVSSICYCMDILGSLCGAKMIDLPSLGRRLSSVIVNAVAGIAYFITAFVIVYTGNFYLILLNRFLNSALQIIVYTYAFESFPTVLRAHASSITRISGRVLNLPTPFLMIDYSTVSYFVMGVLDVSLAIGIYIFNIGETRGKQGDELPEEFKDPEFLKKLESKKNE